MGHCALHTLIQAKRNKMDILFFIMSNVRSIGVGEVFNSIEQGFPHQKVVVLILRIAN